MRPLGAEETELLKHLAYQSRLCQLAGKKCLGIYEKPVLQFLAAKSLSQRQAIFCCTDQAVVMRVMELLVAMPAAGYRTMTHRCFITRNFVPVRPAKVKQMIADTLLVGNDWCLTVEERFFLERCVVAVDPGTGKRAIGISVDHLMDMPKLFELFKVISVGQAFTKIPDAERRIDWADDAPILSLGQRLVALFELCVWDAWQTYRHQSATATVRAFESLDLVAPTVQALERVVAHQQKRKLPLRDFLTARNLHAVREFCSDPQKLMLLVPVARRRYHKRPDILLPTFCPEATVLSALERLAMAGQQRSTAKKARVRRYLTAVQVMLHDLCCVPLLQTFTFMQEYRGVLRNMVLRFAADLAAQALVMSLDTQLLTAQGRSTAAIITRPSSKKSKKKQRIPNSEKRDNDDEQTFADPSNVLTQSSSTSQSSRLVIPLRPSEVSEKEIVHTRLRVMVNQLVHELVDGAVDLSNFKSACPKPAGPSRSSSKAQARSQSTTSSPAAAVKRTNPSIERRTSRIATLQIDDAVQFPPLRRQPPVILSQTEEATQKPSIPPASSQAEDNTRPPSGQASPTPKAAGGGAGMTPSHMSESPAFKSPSSASTIEHTALPLNFSSFPVPAYFWGDWIYQEPQYGARSHELAPPPLLVELTHSLLSSGLEARSAGRRVYPDVVPLNEQTPLPLSLIQGGYARYPHDEHFDDQGAQDSEAADVDDTNSASAQAASIDAADDHAYDTAADEALDTMFPLDEMTASRSPSASRPSTATTRLSIMLNKDGAASGGAGASHDAADQRIPAKVDISSYVSRSRSSSGARTSSGGVPVVTPRTEGEDATVWEEDDSSKRSEIFQDESMDFAISGTEETRQTRASSKPEMLLPNVEAEPLSRFDRKRAESAENIARMHRRDRSQHSEGVASSRPADASTFQRQLSPPRRRPSSLQRASASDYDKSTSPYGFARIRRSLSETRVSNDAQASNQATGERSDPNVPQLQHERSSGDQQHGQEIPEARTVLAVLTGACLRSQAEVAVLVNLLAVQRTIISAMQLDVADSLTALAEQQARLQQPSQALEVMSDEGNTQFASRRRPLIFQQRMSTATPATTTLQQSIQLSQTPPAHRSSQSDLQGQQPMVFATCDDQLMGATLLTHRSHDGQGALEEPMAMLSPRRQHAWLPRSRPPTPPNSGMKHRASINQISREPPINEQTHRATGRSRVRGPRKSEGALSVRLGAQYDSFLAAAEAPAAKVYHGHSARFADHDAQTSTGTIPLNSEPEVEAPSLSKAAAAATPPNIQNPRPWTGFSPRSRLQNNGLCYSILTREIIEFVSRVDEIEERRRAAKSVALQKARSAVQSLWPRAQVKPYGSYVTGLSLPSSDLDMVICLPQVFKDSMAEAPGALEGRNAIKETWQQNLARYLRGEDWVDVSSIKIISHAAIPVIKFNTLPDEQRQLPSVSLDVSFEGGGHHGLAANNLILSLLRQHPAARPLVLVLKHCLAMKGLCEAYTGGLSSYALFLMVARFLQEQHCELDTGAMLLGALNFYGDHFDPRTTGISVGRRCYFGRQYSMLTAGSKASSYFASLDRRHSTGGDESRSDNWRQQDAAGLTVPFQFDPLFIEDPLTPGNNVGRNCFRIFQVQKVWSDLHTVVCEDIRRTEEEGAARPLLSRLVGQYKDMF